jgi:hypothetical protein
MEFNEAMLTISMLLLPPGMCGRPGSPQNGSFIYENDLAVTYTCDEGFGLWGGDKTRHCLNGTWAGNVPRCGESTLN